MEDIRKRTILVTLVGLLLFMSYFSFKRNNKASLEFYKNSSSKADLEQNWLTLHLRNASSYKVQGNIIKCEKCQGGVPNLIIQYGPSRTASTLQFQVLCVMMIMVHGDNATDVGCDYENIPDTKYGVVKTHNIIPLLKLIPKGSWVFLTSKSNIPSLQNQQFIVSVKELYKRNIVIPYVADLNLVLKRGHTIVHEYQSFFNVTNNQILIIAEYFKYWDVLRVCCGTQMSTKWRHVLSSGIDNMYDQNNAKGNLSYPACQIYNIGEIERLLMKTYIYKKYGHVNSVIARTSMRDGKINGSYCERCNSNISKFHLKFLQPCT